MKRGYSEMLEVVNRVTASRPQRALDNLEITGRLVQRLGLDDVFSRLKFVHIAGTKGKGTCAAYTSSLLMSHGLRVGLFTSPHLVDIRERIIIDGKMLSRELFAKYFFDVYEAQQNLMNSDSELDRETASRANFFRLMFLMSLHAFASEGVEVGVMEVGIGGRIDATNVIPSTVCGITSLGMDHMEILGNTVEEIAFEKAGIMKKGVPCFSGPQLEHPSTRRVLQEHSLKVECPLVFVDPGVIPIRQWPQLSIGGEHAVNNSKIAFLLARSAAEISPMMPMTEGERIALTTTVFPGRSQIIPATAVPGGKITLFLDGAHTPESLHVATQWFLDEAKRRKGGNARNVILFYSTREASLLFRSMLPAISKGRGDGQVFVKCILASIRFPRTPVNGVQEDHKAHLLPYVEAWRKLYPETPCLPCAAPFEKWEDLQELVCGSTGELEDETAPVNVFITGSFFLVGEMLELLHKASGGAPNE
ncbi:folylpolyglutamate synthetase, putative [Bodo saltans]|uniref:tetrahydrofolate synthase n=1 Tax=Bodo saltans TaxID=75058 RepID=A0A0S4KJ93_BODSA|nr:folylpolyglutamate synthetase, putative [Bodo saltans]|eukprot:CUI14603.1 folylpolyglutamate synthetase, putative [Bodo saltans]